MGCRSGRRRGKSTTRVGALPGSMGALSPSRKSLPTRSAAQGVTTFPSSGATRPAPFPSQPFRPRPSREAAPEDTEATRRPIQRRPGDQRPAEIELRARSAPVILSSLCRGRPEHLPERRPCDRPLYSPTRAARPHQIWGCSRDEPGSQIARRSSQPGRSGAILVCPLRDPTSVPGRAPEEETLPEEVRRSLKTQQHAHSSTDPSVEMCVQVRRRRPTDPLVGSSGRRCQD
jgi:hypothetical protein